MTKEAAAIIKECDAVKALLLAKNERYGDSAFHPIRVFSKADTLEQLRVRIDDKLSRVRSSNELPDEDTVLDLIGYLVLYRVAQQMELDLRPGSKILLDP